MKITRCISAAVLTLLFLASSSATAQKAKPLTGAFDPEQVLVNLEQRVRDRDWKWYSDFLAPDFRFTPYFAVIQEYPDLEWDQWGRARETGFIRELLDPAHAANLTLLDQVLDRGIESRGRAEWDLVYTLETRGGVFKSRAIFVFEKVDNLWYLLEWTDTTIETAKESGLAFTTSGTLRGVLSR